MTKVKRNLLEGDIKKQLFSLAWPMLMGMIGVVSFNLVDTYFVGLLGVDQLSAMSFSFPIVMLYNSIALGIGVGTSSLVARNIVKTDHAQLSAIASRALLLGLFVVLIFTAGGLLTIRPLFSALGAEAEILDYVSDYMIIWYLGVPFVVIPMIGNNIVRATGDTLVPGIIMTIGNLMNVVLDPLFIFGYWGFPKMGMRGAALATVISRAVGLIAILFVLIKREKLLTVYLGAFKNILKTAKNILFIAGPAALTMLIPPFSAGILTKILSHFGKEAVAAFGVASRVEMFALMVMPTLGSVLIIFIGQNLSKNLFKRIRESLRLSLFFALIWGVFIFIVFVLLGKQIASIFTADPTVIEITKKYFYIIGSSYGFMGLLMLSGAAFNGVNKPYPSAGFSLLRMFILLVFAWLGAMFFEIQGVFWAGFLANVLGGALAYTYLFKTVHKLEAAYTV